MAQPTGEEYTFALCLSHDVDRVYKTYQYVYEAIENRDPRALAGLLSPENPYWQFERIMAIEAKYGVRSSFNILDETPLTDRPKSEWVTPSAWKLYAGRYDVTDPAIGSTLRVLDRLGWEIALHGSYTSSQNPERFGEEKSRIEAAADTELVGNRQHYWRLSRPETWRHLANAGIRYDTSLGDSKEIRFQHGHELVRPFDDDFVVFPWSLMDGAVMRSAETAEGARENCERLLQETRDERTVLCADWHLCRFYDRDNPNWGRIYEWLIERALEMGAWVGPPGAFYEALPHPDGTVTDALQNLGATRQIHV